MTKWEIAQACHSLELCANCHKTKENHGRMGYACISVKPGIFTPSGTFLPLPTSNPEEVSHDRDSD